MSVWLAALLGLRVGAAQSIPTIQVTAEPSDVVDLYRYAAEEAGLEGLALTPACQPWSSFFSMCFMVEEGGTWRLVHGGDLEAWQIDIAELEIRVRNVGLSGLGNDRGRQVDIAELRDDAYWVFDLGDGLDALRIYKFFYPI